MSKRLKGSYTIEAVYIMAITLMAFATVLSAAYRQKEKTVQSMNLHTQVEIQRHQVGCEEKLIRRYASGNGWSLDLTAGVYRPEAWLRMVSLAQQ